MAARRTKPAEGKLQDLYAEASGPRRRQGAAVGAGDDRPHRLAPCLGGSRRESRAEYGVAAQQYHADGVAHTHCGPVLRDNLMDMYEMPPDQMPKLKASVKSYNGRW